LQRRYRYRQIFRSTKGQLYAENGNAADPLAAASQAQAQAGALVNPASYGGGQLSNVFADGLSAFSTANRPTTTPKPTSRTMPLTRPTD
jgi:hypothetical protein